MGKKKTVKKKAVRVKKTKMDPRLRGDDIGGGDDNAGDGREIVSGAFLADAFRVAKRTVQSWKKSFGMPSMTAKDSYDVAEVIEWFVKWKLSEVVVENGDEKRLLKAQADERSEKARMAEINRKQREGELLDADTVAHGQIQRIIAVKTSLEYLAIVLSEKLIGMRDKGGVRKVVSDEVRKCLENFASDSEIEKAKSLTTKHTKHTKVAKKKKKKTKTKSKS